VDSDEGCFQEFGTAEQDALRRDLTINRYVPPLCHCRGRANVLLSPASSPSTCVHLWHRFFQECDITGDDIKEVVISTSIVLASMFYNINKRCVEDLTSQGMYLSKLEMQMVCWMAMSLHVNLLTNTVFFLV
jgi:hypothetical protein